MSDAECAKRYRYLRDTHQWSAIIWDAIEFMGPDEDYGKALDDAVDQAIEESKRNHRSAANIVQSGR